MASKNREALKNFGVWLVTFGAGEVVLYMAFYWIRVLLPVLSGQEFKLIQEEWLSKATFLAAQSLIGLACILVGGRDNKTTSS